MTLYALVATRASIAVDLFASRQEAEAALARIIRAEPHLTDRLRVIPLKLDADLPGRGSIQPQGAE